MNRINWSKSYLLTTLLVLTSLSVQAKFHTSSISNGKDTDHLELQKISDNAYAIVGPLTQRSKKNLGNNATFGFVVTSKGVVLIDAGGSYKGAKKIHKLIKTVTKLPIKYVINSGGQDHRWFGNDYFKKQGAKIIASKAAVADHKKRKGLQYTMMSNLIGETNIKGTNPDYADIVFEASYQLKVGDIEFQIKHAGQAHTPGDSYVWLPKQKIVFAGDIVYMERMLAVGSMSNAKSWIRVYKKLAGLKPKIVVPGHGHANPIEKANRDTLGYLQFLYAGMKKLFDKGIDESRVSTLDQSKYSYLKVYQQLKGRNALKVFMELEYDSMR